MTTMMPQQVRLEQTMIPGPVRLVDQQTVVGDIQKPISQ